MCVPCTTCKILPPPPAVAKDKAPEPFVCKTWLAEPSAVGNVYAPLKVIAPALVPEIQFVVDDPS